MIEFIFALIIIFICFLSILYKILCILEQIKINIDKNSIDLAVMTNSIELITEQYH